MLANHDQFTRQMRNRLKTTSIGLGLVRLLQDARRFEEARMTLDALENGFQNVAAGETEQGKPWAADRLNGVSRGISYIAKSVNHEFVQSTS